MRVCEERRVSENKKSKELKNIMKTSVGVLAGL